MTEAVQFQNGIFERFADATRTEDTREPAIGLFLYVRRSSRLGIAANDVGSDCCNSTDVRLDDGVIVVRRCLSETSRICC